MPKKGKPDIIQVEYIWVRGPKKDRKTQTLCSKTKVIENPYPKGTTFLDPRKLPPWGFDGSSTEQAKTEKSDCLLTPVYVVPDPIQGGGNLLALCEVMDADGKPHPTNTRAMLRSIAPKYKRYDAWFGMEQEYTLYDEHGNWPYGWPDKGYPFEQGGNYCGVGSDEVYGTALVKEHTRMCIASGIKISGTNAEVMPSQWEFQVGPLGPLEIGDQLLIARWLLFILGEKYRISVKLDPKPLEKGNWNGAGMHTNFSTALMRGKGGIKAVLKACEALKESHKEHIAVYGEYNDKRLTGNHETGSYKKFTFGKSDRSASVRIPVSGTYLEDRRPGANADPYKIAYALLQSVCGKGFEAPEHWIELKVKE